MWQFIGVILAVIAIAITVILYWIQRQKRALSWQVVSNTPLLSIDKELKKNLEVLYNGKKVQDVQLIIAKIINTGNVPIKSADYERSINFNFGENAWILTAEVTETSPDSLKASANVEGKKVILPPTLMNKRDWITLKILVNQYDGPISVDGRIDGVKEIKEYTEIYKSGITSIIAFFVGVIGALITYWFTEWLQI
ncbi:hypothetical protein C5S53_11950 [Methanophagales archaeon]|nr:hypothetical protein C5S53_11950 [Methanophagales archaeon]